MDTDTRTETKMADLNCPPTNAFPTNPMDKEKSIGIGMMVVDTAKNTSRHKRKSPAWSDGNSHPFPGGEDEDESMAKKKARLCQSSERSYFAGGTMMQSREPVCSLPTQATRQANQASPPFFLGSRFEAVQGKALVVPDNTDATHNNAKVIREVKGPALITPHSSFVSYPESKETALGVSDVDDTASTYTTNKFTASVSAPFSVAENPETTQATPPEPLHHQHLQDTSLPSRPGWQKLLVGIVALLSFFGGAVATAQSIPWTRSVSAAASHKVWSTERSEMTLLPSRLSSWNDTGNVPVEEKRDHHHSKKDAVCIPGGGFSGFWFTLGQLQSIPDDDKFTSDYYCYSAGCLCVVAFLADLDVHQMLDVAHGAQTLWQQGKLTRFEVVPHFLDAMIQHIVLKQDEQNDWLGNLKIITGVKNQATGWGLSPSVRTPTNPGEKGLHVESWSDVRTMLLQSAWIPFAVGDDLFLEDHIDGGFVVNRVKHLCDRTVEAVWNWELLSTCLNTNLSREQALYFWRAGLRHGTNNNRER